MFYDDVFKDQLASVVNRAAVSTLGCYASSNCTAMFMAIDECS